MERSWENRYCGIPQPLNHSLKGTCQHTHCLSVASSPPSLFLFSDQILDRCVRVWGRASSTDIRSSDTDLQNRLCCLCTSTQTHIPPFFRSLSSCWSWFLLFWEKWSLTFKRECSRGQQTLVPLSSITLGWYTWGKKLTVLHITSHSQGLPLFDLWMSPET